MIKTNLPVLVLRNIVLFPHNEIRIELEKDKDKELISLAESYYNKHILVVHQLDTLEESIDINNFPNVGVIGYINMKLDLPNNKTRIVIKGINRVLVSEYQKEEDNILISGVEPIEPKKLDELEEIAYSRSLIKQVEYYIDHDPNMSNSVLSSILGINDIDKTTDILAGVIPKTYQRKLEYLTELDPTSRVMMILDDIGRELKLLELETEIDEKVSQSLDKSQKEYILQEKIKVIKEELGVTYDKDLEIEKYKKKIEDINPPKKIKKKLYDELSRYQTSYNTSPEVGGIKTYIDTLLSLPWNNKTIDNKDLDKALKALNETHYGLDKVKERIIEYLAVKSMTNDLNSPIICLVGPPGVGKTSLARSIATAMNRKYTKISVGGVNDEADIVGHRRTYIGSMPGKIVQGMKKAGSINPVFVIDEIDKMTKDIKGDPASSLLEVLDKEQNKAFCDNYIEEEYDLSKVMFICTANYKEQIPNELYDRLEIIEIPSYTEYEKLNICKSHIIPKALKEYNLKKENISFSDEAILTIIRNYTKEAGVREVERLINTIFRKIVKDIVVNKSSKKIKIDKNNISLYLGKEKYLYLTDKENKFKGIVNAMSYTPYGGDILKIEVTSFKGKGNIIATGSLGDVFIESTKIALSYIKSNYEALNINIDKLLESDIHIHVPEGAVKKDGPSAGIAITSAIVSLFTDKIIPSDISMTGEITLSGEVLPVGGLREKVLGAKRAGIKQIILPSLNKRDIKELDNEVIKDIKFNYVKTFEELKSIIF